MSDGHVYRSHVLLSLHDLLHSLHLFKYCVQFQESRKLLSEGRGDRPKRTTTESKMRTFIFINQKMGIVSQFGFFVFKYVSNVRAKVSQLAVVVSEIFKSVKFYILYFG